MLKLLIDDLHLPRQNVQLHPELSQPRTIHTVELAKQHWQQARFTVVIGSDLAAQLSSWYRIIDLLREVSLLIVPRPGYPLSDDVLQALRDQGATVAIADLMGPDTSSSAYRERGDHHGLTPPIEAYIHREHLYPCQDVPREKQAIH